MDGELGNEVGANRPAVDRWRQQLVQAQIKLRGAVRDEGGDGAVEGEVVAVPAPRAVATQSAGALRMQPRLYRTYLFFIVLIWSSHSAHIVPI